MKIFITTTEEPAYINPFLKSVVKAIPSEIVGVAIAGGSLFSHRKGLAKIRYLVAITLVTGPIQLLKKSAIAVAFNFFHVLKPAGLRNPMSFADFAVRHGIPVTYVDDINSEKCISVLKGAEPDVIINQAQAILSEDFILVPKLGCLNRHGALLPRYRGRLAPFWAYLNNEKETGITIHFIEKELDSGPILVQKKVPIGRFDSLDSLLKKIFNLAPDAMLEALALIRDDNYQDNLLENDATLATYHSSPTIRDALAYLKLRLKKLLYGK